MASMATNRIVDDRMVSDAKTRNSYQPPFRTGTVMLSAAIEGTGRFPKQRQLDLVEPSDRQDDRSDTLIYFAGNLALLQESCVAIVGTRQVSEAGVRRTRRLARELVNAGVTVVSGLAQGVDTIAHTTAIEAGGNTVAVIGTPLDKVYPAENAPLQETIHRKHLLISQFAPGTRTFRASFPLRNKLMATLADATVVMEASDTSGTLHQAAECTRLNRWLFIARSVAEDASLTWPQKFLKYETTVVLDSVDDILLRISKHNTTN